MCHPRSRKLLTFRIQSGNGSLPEHSPTEEDRDMEKKANGDVNLLLS
jgi:hypothetical protein